MSLDPQDNQHQNQNQHQKQDQDQHQQPPAHQLESNEAAPLLNTKAEHHQQQDQQQPTPLLTEDHPTDPSMGNRLGIGQHHPAPGESGASTPSNKSQSSRSGQKSAVGLTAGSQQSQQPQQSQQQVSASSSPASSAFSPPESPEPNIGTSLVSRSASCESNISQASGSSSRALPGVSTNPLMSRQPTTTNTNTTNQGQQPTASFTSGNYQSGSGGQFCPRCREKRYSVGSHSVRITKHGYACDPAELRYSEISNNLSKQSRRQSDMSFDGSNVAYKVLNLIRGFWSQPAFPHGRLIQSTSSMNTSSVANIFSELTSLPVYPHKRPFSTVVLNSSAPLASGAAAAALSGRSASPVSSGGGGGGGGGSNGPPTTLGTYFRHINTNAPTGSSNELNDPQSEPSGINLADHLAGQPPLSASMPLSIQPNQFLTMTSAGSGGVSSMQQSQATGPTSQAHHQQQQHPQGQAGTTSTILPRLPQANGLFSFITSPVASPTYMSWIPLNKGAMYELMVQLCQKTELVFAAEPRVVQLNSPCLVLGDIHGNLKDLRTYERSLWPKAPICVAQQYLFLGDYVDRGDYSIECVLYLFALKVLAPDKFLLLRGNHEIAAIQRQYTFARECEIKFGQFGRPLWKAFNKCFDLMPLAAVIDNQIYCAHGGIPRSIQRLEDLLDIPTPLENPELQSPAAWEMLWNDPITDAELLGMIDIQNQVSAAGNTSSGGLIGAVDTVNSSSADGGPGATNQSQTNGGGGSNDQGSSSNGSGLILAGFIHSSIGGGRQQQQQQHHQQQQVPVVTSTDGFIANIKRGTAYFYSDQAVMNFLRVNQLSHIIRAHEVIPNGYSFHCEGRVITIFSSSKYCGLNNQSACVLVDRERLRILRLDTASSYDADM